MKATFTQSNGQIVTGTIGDRHEDYAVPLTEIVRDDSGKIALLKDGEFEVIDEPRTESDEKMWSHFDRMQRRVMADKTTNREFFAEPEAERLTFYNWMKQQCGELACWM